jgi:hypothetical protein
MKSQKYILKKVPFSMPRSNYVSVLIQLPAIRFLLTGWNGVGGERGFHILISLDATFSVP